MIRITVVSYNNLAPATPISALFGAEQGTIGRSEDNFLVLPDPKNCVSRTQAKVWSNGTRHQLMNISLANPILINEQEIEPEREYDIHAGDQVRIGSYLLSVIPVEPSDFGQSNGLATTVSHIAQQASPQITQQITKAGTAPVTVPVIVPVTTPAFTPTNERRAKISTPPSTLASKNKTVVQPPQFLLRKDGTPGYIQDMFPVTEPVARRLQPPSHITNTANPPVQQASLVQPPLFTSPALEIPPSSAELLQAFLNGAGLPELNLSSGLTPELMETMGKLVATSVKGTMDLISQRALVKREVNAELTMVVLRKNNPLKFFPDSQTVLTQMLRKKMPGFMTPPEAMEDAFVDLRAHQLAVLVGMRAAMEALLKKLQPASIANTLSAPTLLDYLNPARRKAAMWDHFSTIFDGISLESKDEFLSLFGKEFLAAYENEIERIKHSAHGAQRL